MKQEAQYWERHSWHCSVLEWETRGESTRARSRPQVCAYWTVEALPGRGNKRPPTTGRSSTTWQTRKIRPCAAVCAISTLNVKNIFFSDFALAAAKAKRRYPLPDPFQDSDVGKSGENSDVAKIDAKNKIVHENRPSRPVLLPLPSSAKSTSGSPADTAPLFKTRLMRLRRAKCDCVSVSPVIVARS